MDGKKNVDEMFHLLCGNLFARRPGKVIAFSRVDFLRKLNVLKRAEILNLIEYEDELCSPFITNISHKVPGVNLVVEEFEFG